MKACAPVYAFLLVLVMVFPACSGSGNGDEDGNNTKDVDNGKALDEYLPASGEISGWDEDASRGEPGPQVTTDEATAAQWGFNGAIDKFTSTDGWVGVAEEYYAKDPDLKIRLNIVEMTDDSACGQAYTNMADYSGVVFTDITLGGGESNGRIGSTMFYWQLETTKGKYFVITVTEPKSNDDSETEAKDFALAVLDKFP